MSDIHDFYDPRLYDLAAGDADPCPNTIAYYLDKVGARASRVLDIGAGTGRLAISLAEHGHSVVCVDQSEAMLSHLRMRMGRLDPEFLPLLTILHERFTSRRNEPPVDTALAMDDFLLHLITVEDLRTFFQDLASWIHPRGRFVTDIRPRRTADLFHLGSKPVDVRTFGFTPSQRATANNPQYCTMFWEEYDSQTQILLTTCQYQLVSTDGVVKGTHYRMLQQRIHFNSEVIQVAAENGFRIIELSSRNQPGVRPETDIGGSFEFRLDD